MIYVDGGSTLTLNFCRFQESMVSFLSLVGISFTSTTGSKELTARDASINLK